jgi:hypothetical protein
MPIRFAIARLRGGAGRRRGAAAVTAGLALCGALLGAGRAAAAPAPLHLSVVVGSRQFNANGSYEVRELVYTGTRQTGEGSTRCSRLLGGRRLCSGAFTLESGLIDFAGSAPASSTATTRFTITDGEGRYRRARGTVVSVYSHGGTRAAETIIF